MARRLVLSTYSAHGARAGSKADCVVPPETVFTPSAPQHECDEARDAGYAALEDAGLPVAIKIFEKMTIGESATGSGKGAATNPNGADSTGLELFGSGSGLPMEMVTTYISGASSVDCDA